MGRSTKDPAAERGPLILGAGGRIGRMFRRLAAQGLWPGPEPVWHTRDGRDGTLGWDMGEDPPPGKAALDGVHGVIVLAGVTSSDPRLAGLHPDDRDEQLRLGNQNAAVIAVHLAHKQGLGPVLLCSSAAVYGPGPGPHREDGGGDPWSLPRPANEYSAAKWLMELHAEIEVARLPAPRPVVCALRIGNVTGADALFGAMTKGPVMLDRLADGGAPRRAYIGPLTLARTIVALLAAPERLPASLHARRPDGTTLVTTAALNLAQPGLLPMDDLLRAAGHPFAWRPAPPTALPALEMDLSRLLALVPLPPATPEGLVAEARLAGWRPFGGAP